MGVTVWKFLDPEPAGPYIAVHLSRRGGPAMVAAATAAASR